VRQGNRDQLLVLEAMPQRFLEFLELSRTQYHGMSLKRLRALRRSGGSEAGRHGAS
jgi:hypothetical protein